MNMNTTDQIAKDINQVIEIITQRHHELAEIEDACPGEIEALSALKVEAEVTLESLQVTG